MASSKLVASFFLAVAVAAAATLPPSEAIRVQAPSPDSAPAPPQSVLPGSEQPTACLPTLLPVMPCMDYLTNLTVLRPTTTCCDGFRSVIKDAPICLCHGLNGDLNRIMRDPIDPIRMVTIQLACETMVPLDTLLGCATQTIPPLMPPAASVPQTTSP